MREINIISIIFYCYNFGEISNQIAQRVANNNINNLINIISKKQMLIKKKTILKIVFTFLVLSTTLINNAKINKMLNILI